VIKAGVSNIGGLEKNRRTILREIMLKEEKKKEKKKPVKLKRIEREKRTVEVVNNKDYIRKNRYTGRNNSRGTLRQ